MRHFHREEPKEEAPLRLHIGCGQQATPGWINIDNQALPGVDRVLDGRQPYGGGSSEPSRCMAPQFQASSNN